MPSIHGRITSVGDPLIEPHWQQVVDRFIRMLEERDPSTLGHSMRVYRLAVATAQSLGWGGRLLEMTDIAARLHDIGKILVSPKTLSNPLPTLTSAQREEIIQHPSEGVRLVGNIFPPPVQDGILLHHERYDGRVSETEYPAYPHGYTGTRISPIARLLAVCDTFDAMTTKRPYNPPYTLAQVLEVLRRSAGTRFDPLIVDVFVRCVIPTLTKQASR